MFFKQVLGVNDTTADFSVKFGCSPPFLWGFFRGALILPKSKKISLFNSAYHGSGFLI